MARTNRRIVFAVNNDLVTDQRMHRICSTLQAAGADVMLVGRTSPRMLHLPVLNFSTRRLSVLFHRGMLSYAWFNLHLFHFLLFHPFDLLVSNDLDTLPACRLVSFLRRRRLVFDAHELFTELPELQHRAFVRRSWKLLERLFLPGVRYAYTVNSSLATWYQKKYGLHLEVIRNLPVRKSFPGTAPAPLPGLGERKLILYQGSVNLGRGLELAIDAMELLPQALLLIIGDGDVLQQLKEKVKLQGLGDRVSFTGRLSPALLHDYTVQASVGLSIEEPLGLNYYYSSPNKLYDYIQARVPVLVSPFPEMQELVRCYGIGMMLQERSVEVLARQLAVMLSDESQVSGWKQGLERASRELCWEEEQEKLIAIYRRTGLQL